MKEKNCVDSQHCPQTLRYNTEENFMIYTTYYESPVGRLLLAAKDSALVGAWIEGQKYFPVSLREIAAEDENTPILRQTKLWLERYFAGEKTSVAELNIAPVGSDFRQSVWKILCEIPYGKTATYGEIAKTLAARNGIPKMSAQAVGGAVGHNPISIIIPCHRVVGTNGSLTGYAGGINIKQKLLSSEGVDMSNLFIPNKAAAL